MPLQFDKAAVEIIRQVRRDKSKKGLAKQLEKTLSNLDAGTFTKGMNRHQYQARRCPHGGRLTQVYVQNNTPGAWRLWFCECGLPDHRLVVDVGPHP